MSALDLLARDGARRMLERRPKWFWGAETTVRLIQSEPTPLDPSQCCYALQAAGYAD
jgi:hypothetical protein